MNFEITQTFTIESARFLPHLPKNHPCSQWHGHSFSIRLILRGPLQKTQDWVMDYGDIQRVATPVMAAIDHKKLNEVDGLENPTTENLCRWVYEKIKTHLPQLHQVEIKETPNTSCLYPLSEP